MTHLDAECERTCEPLIATVSWTDWCARLVSVILLVVALVGIASAAVGVFDVIVDLAEWAYPLWERFMPWSAMAIAIASAVVVRVLAWLLARMQAEGHAARCSSGAEPKGGILGGDSSSLSALPRDDAPSDPVDAACLDCGLPYADFPIDLLLPRGQWLLIHPSDGGVLCAQCICRRAAALRGATVVHAVIEIAPQETRFEDLTITDPPALTGLVSTLRAELAAARQETAEAQANVATWKQLCQDSQKSGTEIAASLARLQQERDDFLKRPRKPMRCLDGPGDGLTR